MTIRTLLETAATQTPQAIALRYNQNKTWFCRSYSDFLLGVRQMAEAFSRFEVKPREETVAVILNNGPEWMETYLANSGAGIAVVPLDPKLRPGEVSYILSNSGAVVVYTDKAHLSLFDEILVDLPMVRALVLVDGGTGELAPVRGVACYDYEVLRASVAKQSLTWYDAHVAEPQDVASVIYTSGTTGKPKGAMLTHTNFCSCASGCYAAFSDEITGADSFLIVLPLFHAFSFTTNFVVPMMRGCAMYFVESLRTIGEDVKRLKPTAIMAVPLLAEKMFAKIDDKLQGNRLAQFLIRVGLGRLVGRKVLQGLGGKLRFMIVGGAPCPSHILQGFKSLGIPVLEGYGLTECSPVVSICGSDCSKIGTIGKKISNIEVRLADKNEAGVGELQIRGPIVMKGYYKDIESTREAFDDGWLRTGDLAAIDEDGYIAIRGRKKALIVNREGKNIYPEEVENMIATEPLIADVIVIGYAVGDVPGERVGAIVVPNMDYVAARPGGMPAWDALETEVKACVHRVCENLADYKRPRKVVVYKEQLERTSIQKVRRVKYQRSLDEQVSETKE